jgi:hypothetical protein
MARHIPSLEEWASTFEQTAGALLQEEGIEAGQDGYRLAVATCERHGPGCVVVTYGMFREHLRLAVEDPQRFAERAVATMRPSPGVVCEPADVNSPVRHGALATAAAAAAARTR